MIFFLSATHPPKIKINPNHVCTHMYKVPPTTYAGNENRFIIVWLSNLNNKIIETVGIE